MLRELEAQEAFGDVSLARHDVDVGRVILRWEGSRARFHYFMSGCVSDGTADLREADFAK